MNILYNTSTGLYRNLREQRLPEVTAHPKLRVTEGHVVDGRDVIGRFRDDEHARTTLLAAGYRDAGDNEFAYE